MVKPGGVLPLTSIYYAETASAEWDRSGIRAILLAFCTLATASTSRFFPGRRELIRQEPQPIRGKIATRYTFPPNPTRRACRPPLPPAKTHYWCTFKLTGAVHSFGGTNTRRGCNKNQSSMPGKRRSWAWYSRASATKKLPTGSAFLNGR